MAEHLIRTDRSNDAIQLYAMWANGSQTEDRSVALFNQGVLCFNAGDMLAAETAYRNSLVLWPDFPQAKINLGLLLERQGFTAEALAVWREVAHDTDMQVVALNHRGRLHESIRQYAQAEAVLAESLQLKPSQSDAIQHWVHLRQKQCKWPVMQASPHVSLNTLLANTSPLAMLSLHDDPALQMMAAKLFIKRKYDLPMSRLYSKVRRPNKRLKLGYLSGDLCAHAVGLLLAELIENHNSEQFEVFAFDYSPEDGTPYRARLKQSFEHFVSVKNLTDEQAAQKIADCEIDVLIDLHGLSLGARPGILALKPAQKQGTYLGFMGTTCFPWIDFVVTDRYVFKDDLIPYYSEHPIYVDGCFLPMSPITMNDSDETRASLGLPEDALVLVCFNNVYKFNPTLFGVWMRLLVQIKDAVLWVLDDNDSATEQIKNHVDAYGVQIDRVVFAKRTSIENYRARLRLADLYLDTTPYNAGSTARDVLDACVPMVTMTGKTVVSRMAGSMLKELGMSELVTETFESYESLVLNLAKDRNKLTDYRHALKNSHALRRDANEKLVRSLERQLLSF